jgi:hypothetical protein
VEGSMVCSGVDWRRVCRGAGVDDDGGKSRFSSS